MERKLIASANGFEIVRQSYKSTFNKQPTVEWIACKEGGKIVQFFNSKGQALAWLKKDA